MVRTIESLVGSVENIILTDEIKTSIEVMFKSTLSSNQYQALFIDFAEFLASNVKEGVTTELTGERSVYGLPDFEFRRKTRKFDGYKMRALIQNAVRISPFSINDEQLLTTYADHLRIRLNLTK